MYAVVLVTLLALIASLMLQWMLSRNVSVHRVNETVRMRYLAAGVESQVAACLLNDTSYGKTTCNVPAGCSPSRIDVDRDHRFPVRVSGQGSPPSCRLRIEIQY